MGSGYGTLFGVQDDWWVDKRVNAWNRFYVAHGGSNVQTLIEAIATGTVIKPTSGSISISTATVPAAGNKFGLTLYLDGVAQTVATVTWGTNVGTSATAAVAAGSLAAYFENIGDGGRITATATTNRVVWTSPQGMELNVTDTPAMSTSGVLNGTLRLAASEESIIAFAPGATHNQTYPIPPNIRLVPFGAADCELGIGKYPKIGTATVIGTPAGTTVLNIATGKSGIVRSFWFNTDTLVAATGWTDTKDFYLRQYESGSLVTTYPLGIMCSAIYDGTGPVNVVKQVPGMDYGLVDDGLSMFLCINWRMPIPFSNGLRLDLYHGTTGYTVNAGQAFGEFGDPTWWPKRDWRLRCQYVLEKNYAYSGGGGVAGDTLPDLFAAANKPGMILAGYASFASSAATKSGELYDGVYYWWMDGKPIRETPTYWWHYTDSLAPPGFSYFRATRGAYQIDSGGVMYEDGTNYRFSYVGDLSQRIGEYRNGCAMRWNNWTQPGLTNLVSVAIVYYEPG